MISDSLPARAAIQLFALLQTSIAPLALVYYLHYTIYRESFFHLWFPALLPSPTSSAATNTSVFLHYWLGFELVFYVYFHITRNRLQRILERPSQTNEVERLEIFNNCIATVDDVSSWLVGWFYVNGSNNSKPNFEDIRRENVAEWFAWAFWNSHVEIVLEDPNHTSELYHMVAMVEKRYGVTFPSGYDEDISCIRPTLDPVSAIHRPFVFYAIILTGMQLANAVLRWQGLERFGSESKGYYWSNTFEMDLKEVWNTTITQPRVREEPERIVYWHYEPKQRPNTSASQKRMPVVFIHGVGLGMLSYFEWALRLLSLDREIFLVEMPYVSMQLVEDVPTMEETVRDIEHMLESYGHKQAFFVGHSLGSAVLSWILKHAPKKVSGVVMIDPICFLLHCHDIAYNFVYRVPERANEHVINFFGSRELYISHYFSRHFFWYQTAFFIPATPPASTPSSSAHILPKRTTVFLSEHDTLVNSLRVDAYLRLRGIDTRIMPRLDHASFLFSAEWKPRILASIRAYCEEIDAENEGQDMTTAVGKVSSRTGDACGNDDGMSKRIASAVTREGKAGKALGGRKGRRKKKNT